MKRVTFAALLFLASLSTSIQAPAKAQVCSDSGAYLITPQGECVNLDELQTQRSNQKPETTLKTYIVVFHPRAVDRDQIPAVAQQMAQTAGGRVKHVYQATIQGSAIEVPEAALKGLRNNPLVKSIEPDQTIKLVKRGGGKQNPETTEPTPAQIIPWGITRVGGTGDGTGKTAWVIDTGIDLDHPDLNVDTQRCFTAFRGGKEGRLGCDDGQGHGTHVAGTIAALNNQIGVVGVAAGATVVPVKVLASDGSGTISGVIAGVDHVAANAQSGDVANMSLGGGASTALDDAVKAAASQGIKFAVAAGNEAQNANNVSPARANGTNIYTISAFGQGDAFASFSNYGNPPIDYAAPGVNIRSTWKGGGYNTISGTSMAAPHAAGILLLGSPNSSSNVVGDPDGFADRIMTR